MYCTCKSRVKIYTVNNKNAKRRKKYLRISRVNVVKKYLSKGNLKAIRKKEHPLYYRVEGIT
ncbi:MAG: hypothetical protein ACI8RD_000273 [Bacillariaceae sp.]|jgi:hypothetical protein